MKYYVFEIYLKHELNKFWRKKFDNDKKYNKYLSRFFSKIRVQKKELRKGLGYCWIFKSSDNKSGYRRMLFFDKIILAHRLSFRFFRGKIPKGLLVCHKCDNRKCCNPKHLFLGTAKENTQDMINKGRQVSPEKISKLLKGKINLGPNNGSYTHPDKRPKGSKIGTSKINEEIVLEIRKMYATGKYTQKDLAIKFDLFKGNIQKIITRVTWKHV